MNITCRWAAIFAMCWSTSVLAHDMAGMDRSDDAMAGMDMESHAAPPAKDDHAMAGMDMGGMQGAMGNYAMMRDASGTSWQPDSTPMQGIHSQYGEWSTMLHGYVLGIYDHQGGKRGDDKAFSESMVMGMAQREVGIGRLTLRTMLSLDPLMGKGGYPLLLQTGETADGTHPLVDRQHPHDLFMELSGTYSVPLDANSSVFGYVGYPGEPALGPATFMHRFSGMDNPSAPITHHWLDSTHITYGVTTLGYIQGPWKIEGSLFNGHEPDQFRWNFDEFQLNSASARLSFNPTPHWALQVSRGLIKEPEQLEPGIDQTRTTASASYNLPLPHGNWQSTLAWGRNELDPGPALDAYLLESAVTYNQHTVFARAENAQKNELFETPDPLAGETYRVSAFTLGYIYDIPIAKHIGLGLGASGTVNAIPSRIESAYGEDPMAGMAFMRLKIQ